MNMHPIRLLSIILILLWLSGCSANKNNSQQGNDLAATQDTVKMHSDTMPSPAPPPPGLPPGEARVQGEIVEVGNQADNTAASYFKIKINSVLEYGASTPPVGTSDTLMINMSGIDQNHFKIGKIVSAVISYRQLPGGSGNTSRWALVKLENDSK